MRSKLYILLDKWKQLASTFSGFYTFLLGIDCTKGGFMMMCTASRTSSPWHNFVSDTAHWVDSTGTTPCINNGGIYTSATANSAFLAAIANGAKNIFTDTTDATFLGTPSPKFVSGKYEI